MVLLSDIMLLSFTQTFHRGIPPQIGILLKSRPYCIFLLFYFQRIFLGILHIFADACKSSNRAVYSLWKYCVPLKSQLNLDAYPKERPSRLRWPLVKTGGFISKNILTNLFLFYIISVFVKRKWVLRIIYIYTGD